MQPDLSQDYYSMYRNLVVTFYDTAIFGSTVEQRSFEINAWNCKRELKGLAAAIDTLNIEQGLILTYDQEGSERIG